MFRNVSNQPLYELSTFIKPHISRACLAGLMLILAAASMLALPSYVKDVVDSVLSRNNNIQGNHLMMFAFAASLGCTYTRFAGTFTSGGGFPSSNMAAVNCPPYKQPVSSPVAWGCCCSLRFASWPK